MGVEADKQIKKDLADYAQDKLESEERPLMVDREDAMRELLPDNAEIDVYSTGGWQGSMGFVIWLDDYTWVIKEAYGSCSYCDEFIGTSDKAEYMRSVMRNAYCFRDNEDAIEFLEAKQENDTFIWGQVARHMVELIKER